MFLVEEFPEVSGVAAVPLVDVDEFPEMYLPRASAALHSVFKRQ